MTAKDELWQVRQAKARVNCREEDIAKYGEVKRVFSRELL